MSWMRLWGRGGRYVLRKGLWLTAVKVIGLRLCKMSFRWGGGVFFLDGWRGFLFFFFFSSPFFCFCSFLLFCFINSWSFLLFCTFSFCFHFFSYLPTYLNGCKGGEWGVRSMYLSSGWWWSRYIHSKIKSEILSISYHIISFRTVLVRSPHLFSSSSSSSSPHS